MSPKFVKTLHKQIIADIYQPFSSSADIRNYLRTFTPPICKYLYLPLSIPFCQQLLASIITLDDCLYIL